MKKDILGVKIDDINMNQALEIVLEWLLKQGGKHYIVTPNPEIVVMAKKDDELKRILNKADLAIPDGIGLKLSGDIVCYIPGIDFMERLIKEAAEKGFTIGLLGGREAVAEKVAECLKKKYPKIKIVFSESGGEVDNNGNAPSGLAMTGKCDILFVAFGPPKQEKWIAHNLDKIPVKVAMGVGGAFDFISGIVPRAPGWIRSLGLEWLFRLIVQPWRIKRQLALIKFIFYMIK